MQYLNEHPRTRFVVGALAMVGGMLGSVLVAHKTEMSAEVGYCLFLVSAISSLALLTGDKGQRAMYWLNLFYFASNVYGLLRWFNILPA
jgi:hypothetical protein